MLLLSDSFKIQRLFRQKVLLESVVDVWRNDGSNVFEVLVLNDFDAWDSIFGVQSEHSNQKIDEFGIAGMKNLP